MAFAVKELPGRGRGLVASATIRRGTTAVADAALGAVLHAPPPTGGIRGGHCRQCFRRLVPSNNNGGGGGGFCCTACADAAEASQERILRNCAPLQTDRKFPRLIAVLTAHSLTRGADFQPFWGRVLSLAVPQQMISSPDVVDSFSADYEDLRESFRLALGDAHAAIFSSLPLEWYARMHGICHVNTIGLPPRDPALKPESKAKAESEAAAAAAAAATNVAVGLFGTASLLNHSCEPNLVMHRDPDLAAPAVRFLATRHIPAGEELTISYLQNAHGVQRQVRQEELLHNYGFECGCPLCLREAGQC